MSLVRKKIKIKKEKTKMTNFDASEIFPESMPPARVEGAYLELQDHNRKNTGMGVGMARLIGALIAEATPLESTDSEDVQEFYVNSEGQAPTPDVYRRISDNTSIDVEAGKTSEDLLSLTVDPVLEAVGLARYSDSFVTNGTQAVTNSKQEVVILNSHKYLDFLNEAKAKLPENPALLQLVSETYNNNLATIWRMAMAESSTEEQEGYDRVLQDRLRVLEEIHPTIVEISKSNSLDAQLERGTMYLNWGSKQEFKDFLIMRDLGIREKGTFSAADWHKDMSGPKYEEKWHSLLQHYMSVVASHGSDSDLTVLLKAEISDILGSPIAWPEGYWGDYVTSINTAREKVIAEAKDIGLLI
jgi:hypothetical protein